ncbi:MAG: type II secretion system protein [Fusobacteriaceae bacterium]
MKKRGFTLAELVVAFAIFLVAFIPILELTRGTTLTIARRNGIIGGDSGGGTTSTLEDYTGNILSDFLKQVERTGYTFLSTTVLAGSDKKSRNYTLRAVDSTNSVSTGCLVNQFYLEEDDVLTRNPTNSSKKRCFVQEDIKPEEIDGKKIVMTATLGKIINLTRLPDSDMTELRINGTNKIPPFIYVEAEIAELKADANTVVTPFQDLCVI